jgi:hypothetical protein
VGSQSPTCSTDPRSTPLTPTFTAAIRCLASLIEKGLAGQPPSRQQRLMASHMPPTHAMQVRLPPYPQSFRCPLQLRAAVEVLFAGVAHVLPGRRKRPATDPPQRAFPRAPTTVATLTSGGRSMSRRFIRMSKTRAHPRGPRTHKSVHRCLFYSPRQAVSNAAATGLAGSSTRAFKDGFRNVAQVTCFGTNTG